MSGSKDMICTSSSKETSITSLAGSTNPFRVDGVPTEPMLAAGFVITTAQRYSVLVTTKNTTDANFAIVASMDEEMFDVVPDGLNNNVTGYLEYNSSAAYPAATLVDVYPLSDDFDLVPVVAQSAVSPDDSFDQDILFDNLDDGQNYAFFTGSSYKPPLTPTLFTTIAAGGNVNTTLVTDPEIYGTHTNTHVLKHMDMIEMVLNNQDAGKHPFHLHGHTFQVIKRSEENEGDYNPANTSWTIPANPMRRDTLQLPPAGHAIVRFVSTYAVLDLLCANNFIESRQSRSLAFPLSCKFSRYLQSIAQH